MGVLLKNLPRELELSPLVSQQFYDPMFSSDVINTATFDGQQAAASFGTLNNVTFMNFNGGDLSGQTLQPGLVFSFDFDFDSGVLRKQRAHIIFLFLTLQVLLLGCCSYYRSRHVP